MTDLHQSLDTTIAAIRAEHAAEMQACKDRTLAAEVRAELLQSHVTEARRAQLAAERLAVKLVTQFAVVEKVFAEAKALAEAVYAEEPTKTPVPPVQMDITGVKPAPFYERFDNVREQLDSKIKEIK